MDHTIFYSWQSDTDSKLNRSFIYDALEKASKSFSGDTSFSLSALVDRDTSGLPGSPSIVDAITNKIAKSDIFVCDITIVNKGEVGRLTPNPNVLYELGYASSILGWERIIMVQNVAFGDVNELPFDLRGRRVIPYNLDNSLEGKKEQKEKLKTDLYKTFKTALKHYSFSYNTKDKPIWWGKWILDSKLKVTGGNLQITRVSSDAFFFEISIYDGARTGNLLGEAIIVSPHSAYAKIRIDEGVCELTFKRRLVGEQWIIDLEEGINCWTFHGMGASFSGDYKHQRDNLALLEHLDENNLNEIQRITGEHMSTFLENLQQLQQKDFDENYPDLKIVVGGVKGMYTIMESIAVFDQSGKVWCACLDPKSEIVRYFDNLNNLRTEKPAALIEWLSRFPDRKVIKNNIFPIKRNWWHRLWGGGNWFY